MGLREDLKSDQVLQLGIRKLLSGTPDMKVRDAVAQMRKRRIGCVLVLDDAGRPVSKFTEKRLIKLLLDGPDAFDHPMEDYLIPVGDIVKLTDPISRVMDIIQNTRARFVAVVDDGGKAVGITGQKGLINYLAERFPRAVKTQVMDSKMHQDQREGA